MSSTGQPGQAVPSTSSSGSNAQYILNGALADYAKITGIDLSKHPFAAKIEKATSPKDILLLLQERVTTYTGKESSDGNQRLTSILNPAVNVLYAFSGVLGEAHRMVSYTCHLSEVSLLT